MPFLTLHELSLQFDIPVRVLRYRLRQLLQENKLVEGDDYRRDDFVDDTHFVWKINPVSFVRLTGAKPVASPVTQVDSKLGNEPSPLAMHFLTFSLNWLGLIILRSNHSIYLPALTPLRAVARRLLEDLVSRLRKTGPYSLVKTQALLMPRSSHHHSLLIRGNSCCR